MGWRYGACQRTYKTILADGTERDEVLIELVEVFPNPFGYTADAVSIYTDEEGGKKGLADWLQLAAKDVAENDLIVDPDVVVTDLRKT